MANPPRVKSGSVRIDAVFNGDAGAKPIDETDAQGDFIGYLQDLLIGLGQKPARKEARVPNLLDPEYRTLNEVTKEHLKAFQRSINKPSDKVNVDGETLRALADAARVKPQASLAYMTLNRKIPYSGLMRVLSFTAIFEGSGLFDACNLNSDGAGLSYGIIQWAQKPGRLQDIVKAFKANNAILFDQLLGPGIGNQMLALISNKAKNYGVDEHGNTIDPTFKLIDKVWVPKFKNAAKPLAWQNVQIVTALAAFKKSIDAIRIFDKHKVILSERSFSFMLDLANQHGDPGAKKIYEDNVKAPMNPSDALAAMRDNSVSNLRKQFPRMLFQKDAIQHLPSLAIRLLRSNKKIHEFLRNAFSKDTKKLLEDYVAIFELMTGNHVPDSFPQNPEGKLVNHLVSEFNKIISDSFYTEELFEEIKPDLSNETKDLLKDHLQNPLKKPELLRLNRMLLEDALPEIQKLREYSPLLKPATLLDSRRFLVALMETIEPVSKFIRGKLSATTLTALQAYSFPAPPAGQLVGMVLADLNKLIKGPSISGKDPGPDHDPDRFKFVTLLPETKYLLKQNPTGAELMRLNRLLIGDRYSLLLQTLNENNQSHSTATRRDQFRYHALLSDADFVET